MNDESDEGHDRDRPGHEELSDLDEFYVHNPDLRPEVLDWDDLHKPEDRWAVAGMIALERKARGVTQRQLSDLSGVSLRTLKHIDAGEGSPPKASTLLKVYRAIIHGEPSTRDTSVQMLAEVIGPMYAQLTPKQQAEALRRIVLLLNEIKEY